MELWEEEEEEAGLAFQVTVGTLWGGDWTEGAREGQGGGGEWLLLAGGCAAVALLSFFLVLWCNPNPWLLWRETPVWAGCVSTLHLGPVPRGCSIWDAVWPWRG